MTAAFAKHLGAEAAMNNRVDLFVSAATRLADARLSLEAAYNIPLAAHESEYQGREYFRFVSDEFTVILKKNFEDDGELVEADHVAQGLLLYLTGDEATIMQLGGIALGQGFKLLKSSAY